MQQLENIEIREKVTLREAQLWGEFFESHSELFREHREEYKSRGRNHVHINIRNEFGDEALRYLIEDKKKEE